MRRVVRAMKGVCPACGQRPLFYGWLNTVEACGQCNTRHDRPGSFPYAGAATVAVGLLAGVAISWVLDRAGWLRGGAELPVIVASSVLALAAWRPLKALALALAVKQDFDDPEPDSGKVIFLDQVRARRGDREKNAS